MATEISQFSSNCSSFSGGVTAIPALEEYSTAVFSGTWVIGDNWTVILQDAITGLQTQVGDGFVTAVQPTFIYTFNQKIYALAGANFYCCSVKQPTIWNDPNATGNGFEPLQDTQGTSENLVSMSLYQGRLVFYTRRTVQIWLPNEDLAQWSILQTFTNIGTFAANSVASLGDLDNIFLSDTGIRSLRVHDSSLNAFVTDIGSPIDAFVQSQLFWAKELSVDITQALGIVEPTQNRYWCYIPVASGGVPSLFVLSYFPSNKEVAWSEYVCTDSNGDYFFPQQFFVFQGQAWVFGTDSTGNPACYQYGGTNGNTFDNTIAQVETTFIDAKSPGLLKTFHAIDVGCNTPIVPFIEAPASWLIDATIDPQQGSQGTAVQWESIVGGPGLQLSSFDTNQIPFERQGSHLKLRLTSQGSGPAVLSELVAHYDYSMEP